MKRAVIIVKGKVQRVGYRDVVQEIARKTNITGCVQNLHPYDVEIVAEGEEKDLERFIKSIRIQKTPIFVEDMEISYRNATGEFDHMEIKWSNWQKELAERMDVGVNVMYEIRDTTTESLHIGKQMLDKQDQTIESIEGMRTEISGKQDQTIGSIEGLRTEMSGKQDLMLDKQDQMIGKQDQMVDKQDKTIGSIENLRGDMGQRFDRLDDKYGEINKNILKAIEKIDQHLEISGRSIEVFQTTMEGLLKELIAARKGGLD